MYELFFHGNNNTLVCTQSISNTPTIDNKQMWVNIANIHYEGNEGNLYLAKYSYIISCYLQYGSFSLEDHH